MTEHENRPPTGPMTRRLWLAHLAAWGVGLGAWPVAMAQSTGSVSVGFLSHYPPFSFRDRDGALKGFDLDVMQRLCAIMGVALVQVPDGMATLSQKRYLKSVMCMTLF